MIGGKKKVILPNPDDHRVRHEIQATRLVRLPLLLPPSNLPLVGEETVLKLYHDKNDSFDRNVLSRLCAFLGVGVGDLLVYVREKAAEPGR